MGVLQMIFNITQILNFINRVKVGEVRIHIPYCYLEGDKICYIESYCTLKILNCIILDPPKVCYK